MFVTLIPSGLNRRCQLGIIANLIIYIFVGSTSNTTTITTVNKIRIFKTVVVNLIATTIIHNICLEITHYSLFLFIHIC